jgi:hypothetical protein
MEALKMERPMDSWNDERLDELSRRMDEGFKEMREGFARMVTREEMKELIASINAQSERIEGEMKEGFERADQRFEKVATRESATEINSRLDRFEVRIDRLYWAYVALAVLLIANGIIGNA